jgi:predicted AAA+ superfamily ATPase
VLQQLIGNKDVVPFYWSAEKSDGEIDFVFQSGMDIVPLEVKAVENLQAKSLKSYCLRYKPKHAIRTSMSDYRREERLTNLPLYAVNMILNILD